MAQEANEDKKGYIVNPFLWAIPLILSGIGITMITSTTSPNSFMKIGTPFYTGLQQAKWLFLSLIGMYFSYKIPVKTIKRFSPVFYMLIWFLTFMTLLPGIGVSINGARRWIRFPIISLQPGELLVLASALRLSFKLNDMTELSDLKKFIKTFLFIIFTIIPLVFQPDFGTSVLIFIVCMGIYVECVGWKYPVMIGLPMALPAIIGLVLFASYRIRRILAFLDPWDDPFGKGFQTIQGLIAFANGGLFGMGLGHGFQKLNYLPAAYTDFIFAAVGEELGFVGTLCVLGLFLFWVFQARAAYYRTTDSTKATLIWGIILTVILPLAINVSGVIKILPLTGIALPFLTYGGTSLVTMWARVGLIMRLDRESRED